MLLGKNEVIEWIALNGTPYWNIRRNEKGARILSKAEPENLTIEESQAYLERVLDMFEKGTYHIDAYKKGMQPNQYLKSAFRIGSIGTGIEGSSIGSIDDIESRVMEKLRKEMEFDRLKTENEELRREIESVNHNVSRRLEPYIPHIIESVFGTKIETASASQVAGIPDEDLEDQQKRLEVAFSKWFEIEKESSPVIIVEKFIELAEKNPAMYAQAKKLLLG